MKNTSYPQATMMGFGRSNLQAYCHPMDVPGLGAHQVMSYSDFLSWASRTVPEQDSKIKKNMKTLRRIQKHTNVTHEAVMKRLDQHTQFPRTPYPAKRHIVPEKTHKGKPRDLDDICDQALGINKYTKYPPAFPACLWKSERWDINNKLGRLDVMRHFFEAFESNAIARYQDRCSFWRGKCCTSSCKMFCTNDETEDYVAIWIPNAKLHYGERDAPLAERLRELYRQACEQDKLGPLRTFHDVEADEDSESDWTDPNYHDSDEESTCEFQYDADQESFDEGVATDELTEQVAEGMKTLRRIEKHMKATNKQVLNVLALLELTEQVGKGMKTLRRIVKHMKAANKSLMF